MLSIHRRSLTATLLAVSWLLLLSGCTTYTWDDGNRETVWGVPAEDETLAEQERQNRSVRHRTPGKLPETH
ncbi:MAG: hypothetical protein ACTH3D_12295 [Halomonas sp.]|uniref:hypothetical protein n=1 Tax=Halomonas sp. TaxID=1486246 RepID=UPI003F916F74